jgi:hypothetical protein
MSHPYLVINVLRKPMLVVKFYCGHYFVKLLAKANGRDGGSSVFAAYHVHDPQRYGVRF